MCQLPGLSSSEPIRLTFSWETFMLLGSQQGGNPDGWGVAYFEGVDATLLRESMPMAESPMVEFLNHHAPLSDLIISHVRRATSGERNLANTHPFRRVLGGHTHIFAHNGFVPASRLAIDSSWLVLQGDTDSEILFCRLLGYLEPLWNKGAIPALEERYQVVTGFARGMLEHGAANFLYSDGINLFAHGHRRTLPGEAVSNEPGLYLNMSTSKKGSSMKLPCQGLSAEGWCSRQAIVSSLPLNDGSWTPLQAGEVACFQKGQRIY
jgi:glutamine amidotransferase